MIFTLVYISRAKDGLEESDLREILQVSRSNNTGTDISGMLLYKQGEFMQALEGKRQSVESLFERISQDERHSDVLVLARKEIPQRNFDGWSMGFENISGKAQEGMLDPQSFFSQQNDFQQGATALNFLSSFYHD